MDVAQQRQAQMEGVAGEKRVAHRDGTEPCGQGEQQAGADPAPREQRHVGLHPMRSRDDVLEQQRHRKHQACDKSATGLIVSAHEQVERHHGGKGQQKPHQHGRHHQIADGGVGGIARIEQVGLQVGRHEALLFGQVHGFARGAKAPQQCIHREGHHAQHHDFAKGVKTTEIHQHHVDHVGATALAECVFQEERGCAVGKRAAHHGKGQPSHAAPCRQRQRHVALAAPPGGGLLGGGGNAQGFIAFGQPTQAQQNEHRGHDLDHQLSQRQVGCRKPQKRDAGAKPCSARQCERCQAVVFGLPGGCHGAYHAHAPEHHERGR